MKTAVLLGSLAGSALGAAGPYAQCGGQGWTGDKSCVDGYTCTVSNDWYSQCLPGTAKAATTLKPVATKAATTAKAAATSKAAAVTIKASATTKAATAPVQTSKSENESAGRLKWIGSNQAGAEFGEGNLPGTFETDYIFPDPNSIATLIKDGYNMFRIGFRAERLAQGTATAALDKTYLGRLKKTVEAVTSQGKWAVIEPHNYGRYHGSDFKVADFKTFWKNVATEFKDNDKVVFDTNNEFHDQDQTLVLNLNQAAIDGIRAAGATSQYIFVEGNAWTGAWSWTNHNDNMKGLTDPNDKIVYEMHQYLDGDSSGTSPDCVSKTIGAERVAAATKWLRENNKVGIIGEFAGGANEVCKEAVTGLLDALEDNSDVWMGAIWWAGGPWWHDYMYSFEPPSGTGYKYYNDLLKTYQA